MVTLGIACWARDVIWRWLSLSYYKRKLIPASNVGTRELKNRLSQYLRRVKAGETVIITEHGKPVGQIIPIPADLASRLKKLSEAGIIDKKYIKEAGSE